MCRGRSRRAQEVASFASSMYSVAEEGMQMEISKVVEVRVAPRCDGELCIIIKESRRVWPKGTIQHTGDLALARSLRIRET